MGPLNKHCYFEEKAGETTIGWPFYFLFGLSVAVVVCSLDFFFFFRQIDLDTAAGLDMPALMPY